MNRLGAVGLGRWQDRSELRGRCQLFGSEIGLRFEHQINRMDEGKRSSGSDIPSRMKSVLGNLWSRLMVVRSRCPVVKYYAGSVKKA